MPGCSRTAGTLSVQGGEGVRRPGPADLDLEAVRVQPLPQVRRRGEEPGLAVRRDEEGEVEQQGGAGGAAAPQRLGDVGAEGLLQQVARPAGGLLRGVVLLEGLATAGEVFG